MEVGTAGVFESVRDVSGVLGREGWMGTYARMKFIAIRERSGRREIAVEEANWPGSWGSGFCSP